MSKLESRIVYLALRGGELQDTVYLCNGNLVHLRDGHSFQPCPFTLRFDMRMGQMPRFIIEAGLLDQLNTSVINATFELAARDRPEKIEYVVRTIGRRRGEQLLLHVEDGEPYVNLSDLY